MSMEMVLSVVAEAIFVVSGQPDLKHRQCPLTMDKWLNLIVTEHQLALGLIWNTRKLAIDIPRDYLDETLHLLRTVWPRDRLSRKKRAENVFCPGSFKHCRKVWLTHGGSSLCSILELLFLYVGCVCTSTEHADTAGLLPEIPRSH